MKAAVCFGPAWLLVTVLLLIGCSPKEGNNKVRPSSVKEQPRPVPSGQDNSICQAALEGNFIRVTELLQQGAHANQGDQDGRTALMYAAYEGHTGIVQILLENKASINQQDTNGRTALMFAASGPFPETVKLLLDHHADPNVVDFEEHFTALMFAAAEGQLENVKILLEGNADHSMKDIDGDNALNFARKNGHIEVVRLLEKQH